MAVHSAREIYRFARLAGFSPDQAVTMTAIALAESGGDSRAHAVRGEDSRGLWQINVAAHGDWATRHDLYDPLQNALAAFRVSGRGADVSPWTVTHTAHGTRYLTYRTEAEAAARACGDGTAVGAWSGTAGYGHPLPAAGEREGVRAFLDAALAQSGDRYAFGAEARATDPDPTVFDCSELVQWAAARAGVRLPDGSWTQYLRLREHGATIDVERALRTPGALLFSFSEVPTAGGGRPATAHVAISLGDGRTIEARGRQYGVGSWSAGHRFQYAAVIPGLTDDSAGSPARSAAADSDGDNLSDGYELTTTGSDPTRADTDGDGALDAVELLLGTRSTDADSDRDGVPDGAANRGEAPTDADGDRLTDALERLLGSDPGIVDSDGDGFTDGAEYRGYFDPVNPAGHPLASPAPSGRSGIGRSGVGRPAATPDPSRSDAPAWGLDDA